VPVPPYAIERVEVAETTPLFAWRGPVREPTVKPPAAASAPVNVVFAYVFAIVEDAAIERAYYWTRGQPFLVNALADIADQGAAIHAATIRDLTARHQHPKRPR
jgi:hypothetical protein